MFVYIAIYACLLELMGKSQKNYNTHWFILTELLTDIGWGFTLNENSVNYEERSKPKS